MGNHTLEDNRRKRLGCCCIKQSEAIQTVSTSLQ